MYFMSSPFYHSFAMLNHTFSYHLHTMSIIHGILFIMHHCTRIETVTLEQEEVELEIVGDNAPVETQGRHLCIFYPLYVFLFELEHN